MLGLAIWAVVAFSVYVGLLVFRTRQIRGDISQGIGKLEARVDERERRLEALEADIKGSIGRVEDAISAQTGAGGTEMAQSLENALNEGFSALQSEIGPIVSTHINMALKQAEAQQSKRVGQFLKDVGLDGQIEALEEGVKQEALEAAGPMAQVCAEILSAKIPKSATMGEKAWLQTSKLVAAQLMQGSLAQFMPGQSTAVVENVNTGFGVRPRG